jgi:hypothetical protein
VNCVGEEEVEAEAADHAGYGVTSGMKMERESAVHEIAER